MTTKKINIKNPSKEVLDFFRNMRWAKQEKKLLILPKKIFIFLKQKHQLYIKYKKSTNQWIFLLKPIIYHKNI